MTINFHGRCQFKACKLPATHIACGPAYDDPDGPGEIQPAPNCYCEAHANDVARGEYKHAEYVIDCPNCKYKIGV